MYLLREATDAGGTAPTVTESQTAEAVPAGRTIVMSDGVTRTTMTLPVEVSDRLPDHGGGFVELMFAISGYEPPVRAGETVQSAG